MIRRLVSLLRQIVGRVKMYKTTLWLGFAAIMIPISLMVVADKKLALIGLGLGFIALIMAVVNASIEERRDNAKFKLQMNVLISMLNELKRMRGEDDGSSNPDH
jgi:4-hydroxybenzoate polyprenyltransferase